MNDITHIDGQYHKLGMGTIANMKLSHVDAILKSIITIDAYVADISSK